MKSLIHNFNNKMRRVWGNIHCHEDNEKVWYSGTVFTPYGIVAVNTNFLPNEPLSVLRIVYKGRLYYRRISKNYTSRGLITVAHKFAREMVEEFTEKES